MLISILVALFHLFTHYQSGNARRTKHDRLFIFCSPSLLLWETCNRPLPVHPFVVDALEHLLVFSFASQPFEGEISSASKRRFTSLIWHPESRKIFRRMSLVNLKPLGHNRNWKCSVVSNLQGLCEEVGKTLRILKGTRVIWRDCAAASQRKFLSWVFPLI